MPRSPDSVRSLLLFDVLADDGDRGAAAGRGEVARAPQHALPVALGDVPAVPSQEPRWRRPSGCSRGQRREPLAGTPPTGGRGRPRHPSPPGAPRSSGRQTAPKISRSRSMAGPSNTWRRYLATKTKCTCRLKTQCRPCRISLSAVIGQVYRALMRLLKAYCFRLEPTPTMAREMGR